MSPLYRYEAVDARGRTTEGEMNAPSDQEIANVLKSRNLTIVSIENATDRSPIGGHRPKRIGVKEKILVTTYLATMIRAGSPLIAGIDVLLTDAHNTNFIRILQGIKEGLEKGRLLSETLSLYPDSFDQPFVAIIKAGETSGQLENVLQGLSQKLKRDQEMTGRVKAALSYPLVILIALVIIGGVMMIFVLPKLIDSFLKVDIKLPWTTMLLVRWSQFITNNTLLATGLFFGGLGACALVVRTRGARTLLIKIGTIIPVTRNLFYAIDMARLTSTLSILLKTGVPVERSLAIASDVVSSNTLKKILKNSVTQIIQGVSIAQSLRQKNGLIPEIMIKVIQVGEETGSLDQSLDSLTDSFNEEVHNRLQALSVIIEPVLMLIVGVVVGAFVFSIIGPIYQVVSRGGQ